MYRTHTCGELTDKNDSEKVVLSGWVHRRRDHGGIIFIDLRDRYGLTQIVSDPENLADAHNEMDKVRSEYVLRIEGKVRPRPDGQTNENLKTGKIEILVDKVEILNAAQTPPFEIDQEKEVGEELRLKYRYLDLRRERVRKNIMLRHKVINYIRNYLDEESFVDVETPILIKGTPEGSREYLVPSRIYPGTFYVLPQSPQQLKQLLMVAGFDRYFQIPRCFRDEDQRGDRQPEFTQLDMEMSFVTRDDVMSVNEGLMTELVEKFVPQKKVLKKPFPVLSYEEAMNQYGSDSPDLRYELKLSDISKVAAKSGFGVFADTIKNGGVVKALRVEGGAKFARREIDELEAVAKIYRAKGLAYVMIEDGSFKSSLAKFFEKAEQDAIMKATEAVDGDIVFFVADDFEVACESLGAVRKELAKRLELIDENLFAFCWVVDFPMFEKDKESGRLGAVHHPFTSPNDPKEFIDTPETAVANAYDLVLNGTEVAGGSIRIHDGKVQKKVFDVLGISDEDAKRRFGHLLEAFSYGAPPHGGIAWGLDRLIMIFADEPNIREVIAFPKDQKAKDLMLGAPSPMPKEQVEELHIKVVSKEK